MAKKIVEKKEYHPDTYRIKCFECERLFEAENEDFRFFGGDQLICKCPWCGGEMMMSFRKVHKAKIHYGSSIHYEV